MPELKMTSAEEQQVEAVAEVAAKITEIKIEQAVVATKIQTQNKRKSVFDMGKVDEDEFDEDEDEEFYNYHCNHEENEIKECDENASVEHIDPTRFCIIDDYQSFNDTSVRNVKQDVIYDACINGLYVGNKVHFSGSGVCKILCEAPKSVDFLDILHIDVKTPRIDGEKHIMEISVYDKYIGYKSGEWQEYVFVKPFEKTESDNGIEHFSALFDRRAYAKKLFNHGGTDLLHKDCIVQINFVHAVRDHKVIIESVIRPNAAAITIGKNKFITAIDNSTSHFSGINQMVIVPTTDDGQKYCYNHDFDFDTTPIPIEYKFPKELYIRAQHRKIKGIRQRFVVGIHHLRAEKDSLPVSMVILNAKTIEGMKVYSSHFNVDRYRHMQPGVIFTLSSGMITDLKF